MRLADGTGVVVYAADGGTDAIDQYTRVLAAALSATGVAVEYAGEGLRGVLGAERLPDWVLLQYNPFSYARWGFAPHLVRDAIVLRRRGVAFGLMVHEAWVEMADWRSGLMGLWQRLQLRALVHLADRVLTSTDALAREIGHGAVTVPVPSNIPAGAVSREAARAALGLDGQLVVALFGRAHPSRALDHAEAAIAALAGEYGARRLMVLNLGDGAPAIRVPGGVEMRSPGFQEAQRLSLCLTASDLVLLPFTDGVSTRRTTLAAALAHGRPIVGLRGANTDAMLAAASGTAMLLTAAGDKDAFAREAVSVTRSPALMRRLGAQARELYDQEFAPDRVARRVATALGGVAPAGRRPSGAHSRAAAGKLVFVANDVGDLGGMERQSAELVRRLLDAGWQVTVIARTCDLRPAAGLRFVRVRLPARPAALAYPGFVAAASMLARRRGDSLLHTTGALVLNRADVSTVHYCHRTAARLLEGSRASRASRLYRINAAAAGALARAAELWCYRPARTGVLCAVSPGVAGELRDGFPAMRDAIRTVPNGVDTDRFAPDPGARAAARSELGLNARDRLAVFVGGDWERKGLRHAVDALALAPGWHLAVAGAGEAQPLVARARQAGTGGRLHILGPVHDTPRLYAAGDAFVLPTAYETFSLVTYEAAASGLPLLVTRVSGVEDLLEDGANGWFIDREPVGIAARLRQLSDDPQLARALGDRARTAAARHSWGAMADGYLAVYSELTAAAPLPAR